MGGARSTRNLRVRERVGASRRDPGMGETPGPGRAAGSFPDRRSRGPDGPGGVVGVAVAERGHGETGGTPGTVRGGSLSKSATKAPRVGIGREQKRGISTFLLRRPSPIRAFVADLDNLRRRGPRQGPLPGGPDFQPVVPHAEDEAGPAPGRTGRDPPYHPSRRSRSSWWGQGGDCVPYCPSRRSRSSTLSGRRTHPCFAPSTQATPGRGKRL